MRTLAAFKAALKALAEEEGLLDGFAVRLPAGQLLSLEASLEKAFERQGML